MSERRPAVLVVRFRCRDGTTLERSWTIDEPMPAFLHAPPEWLEEPRRTWKRPQDPVTLTGNVKPGREADARLALSI